MDSMVIVCVYCGRDLTASFSTEAGKTRIEIEPCDECLNEAFVLGIDFCNKKNNRDQWCDIAGNKGRLA